MISQRSRTPEVFLVVVISGNPRPHWLPKWWPWHAHQKVYKLKPNRKIKIMTDVTVGHVVTDTIAYLDANGNPMLTVPTPDSPPTWANTADPTVDTMTVSADGSTATIDAVGVGTDTVTLTVVVGGVTFTATQQLSVDAAPQVLTSVAINASVA